ncbi:hypothetical protein EK21DRAFT_107295 [Setomelanomma holmii]|uniref:Uncharacterized protein n=1 Tax=Setomelanomma holmii TaxID=210430 RepID=A0A9P4HIH1_9PLEO|nr:hypothetical protein EK21DRAFT_107295 [Setomelanomma holmii]
MKRQRKSSLERDIDASSKKLKTLERVNLKKKIKINRLDIRIAKLLIEREGAKSDLEEFHEGALLDGIHVFSKTWNLSFALKLLRLPREIRDLVYAQIWTQDYISATLCPMVGTLQGEVYDVPHVVDKEYVGSQIALEVVEAYYNHAPDVVTAMDLDDIERLINDDVFDVGLDPAAVLRHMNIELAIDDYLVAAHGSVDFDAIRPSLAALLDIEKKSGFKLKIDLLQVRIRLKVLDEYIKLLGPILHEFESQGANVEIWWMHHTFKDWRDCIGYRNITDVVRDPSIDWRPRFIKRLDKNWEICDDNRDYRVENRPEYKPDDLLDLNAWSDLDEEQAGDVEAADRNEEED